jgi:hypothetical protein
MAGHLDGHSPASDMRFSMPILDAAHALVKAHDSAYLCKEIAHSD